MKHLILTQQLDGATRDKSIADMDCGLIKIGDIATKASADDIRTLKSILDRHRIYHIVDGITFFHPCTKAVRLKENDERRSEKVDTSEVCLRKHKDHHSDHYKFRELIVPDLYKLDYMNLIFFESEEADFLATIVYGGH